MAKREVINTQERVSDFSKISDARLGPIANKKLASLGPLGLFTKIR